MAALPMPDEFRLFRFDRTKAKQDMQVSRVIEWVVHKNGLYNMLEMAAMKGPFAAGIGAGGKDGGTVNRSINRMMNALEQIPAAVEASISPHIEPFLALWREQGGLPKMWEDDDAPNGGYLTGANPRFDVSNNERIGDDYNTSAIGFTGGPEDAKLTYRLAPEGRLSLVVQQVENAYAMIMARIAASHPIIALFDPYIVTGQEGKAGTSISLAQSKNHF